MMRVDLYHVDQGTDVASVEVLGVELATCFPDDPQDVAQVEADIEANGFAMYGGGAVPLFKFVKAI